MSDLQSVHTNTFPQLLRQLGISLIVSTYQAGKLIVIRDDAGVINTHFRSFPKPMGIAVKEGKIALGTGYQIWDLRNVPAVAPRIHPPGKHDACYLPRRIHLTGDIDIHEMAYIGDELWFINTRFSCLCTLDPDYSFVPRWRPPFVSAYEASDRCHLNGLAVRNDQVTYVTALGSTDTAGGWREDKHKGGIVMDITTNNLICQGLSMPHSPRWYGDRLWVLESGDGSLAQVNLATGALTTVAQLPGFTRGIDFWGDYAFIGLSKVRESAVFSGIPITQRLTERICGVWVVSISTGKIVAFLRFTTGVEEIFAVQVLPGQRFPEIINDQEDLLKSSYIIPDRALAEVAVPSEADLLAAKQREIQENAVKSFVVVVPVYNITQKGQQVIQRTLDSIDESINYFLLNHPQATSFAYEVVIVDDASEDETEKIIQSLIQDKAHYRYLRHDRNLGQSQARNTGVNASLGEAIFFCDDDDLFYLEHITTCIKLINQPLPDSNKALVSLRGNYPGAVKTGVNTQTALHSHWQQKVTEVLVLNTCIRREAHNFIEGFPIEEVFRLCSYGNEDYAYAKWLTSYFNILWVKEKTVEYIRYPGNHFDRQLARWQQPPNGYQETITPKDVEYLHSIEQLISQKQQSLLKKLQASSKADYYLTLGNQAFNQGNLVAAEHYYKHCLFLERQLLNAWYNLGVVYLEQEALNPAQTILERVITLEPNHAEAYNNLGNIYNRRNQFSTAVNYYRKAIERRHQFPDAHFNLGMTLLKMGEFTEGWAECEWRWQRKDFTPIQCSQPQWKGEDLPNDTILVHTEQGAGDAIQFIRYLPLVAKKCQRVILCCPENLISLFKTIPEIAQIFTPGNITSDSFAVYSPLMSLPHCLGTTLTNIPAQVPYLGKGLVNEQLTTKLTRLIPATSRPKIGIVWAGSPTHANDRHRSSNLSDWLPLLRLEGIDFYSLQKGPKASQIAQLPPEIKLTDLSNYLGDYADSAIALSYLDLIISVDTSVAHLAGALAKPVWTLLSFYHDWRWLCDRLDSPWYPTMKLFRQSQLDNWSSVMETVVTALTTRK
ncbi:TIGR03032 family protein [Gloeocapsa sp. PCC 73106]|uniref:TIGR03032 family protein n=1 Tax=Gloeocapsa sp. PCC 73106 TaxID=102232 RepID=UPI0002AC525E|nr:TIGR03032 family protein [Gloeocapsa sp. PCC 73106]ELR98553.1 TIGR03032 family protein [Gloeocapsa sp. PCC 73106]